MYTVEQSVNKSVRSRFLKLAVVFRGKMQTLSGSGFSVVVGMILAYVL